MQERMMSEVARVLQTARPDERENGLSARLNVSLPGADRDTAPTLINEASEICTHSRATRCKIDVAINLV